MRKLWHQSKWTFWMYNNIQGRVPGRKNFTAVTTWMIFNTGASYLTTGTLCIVTYHKHNKSRRFYQGLFDSQSPESSPEWEACGSWWSRGRRWGRGAGSSQRWRSTPADADEMKLATKNWALPKAKQTGDFCEIFAETFTFTFTGTQAMIGYNWEQLLTDAKVPKHIFVKSLKEDIQVWEVTW